MGAASLTSKSVSAASGAPRISLGSSARSVTRISPSCRKMVSSFTESHCAESAAAAAAAAAAADEPMALADGLTVRSSRPAGEDASRSRRDHQSMAAAAAPACNAPLAVSAVQLHPRRSETPYPHPLAPETPAPQPPPPPP